MLPRSEMYLAELVICMDLYVPIPTLSTVEIPPSVALIHSPSSSIPDFSTLTTTSILMPSEAIVLRTIGLRPCTPFSEAAYVSDFKNRSSPLSHTQ